MNGKLVDAGGFHLRKKLMERYTRSILRTSKLLTSTLSSDDDSGIVGKHGLPVDSEFCPCSIYSSLFLICGYRDLDQSGGQEKQDSHAHLDLTHYTWFCGIHTIFHPFPDNEFVFWFQFVWSLAVLPVNYCKTPNCTYGDAHRRQRSNKSPAHILRLMSPNDW